MSEDRLPAGLEAASFLRHAQALGGFGTVLHKGDESRGSILLAVLERGVHVAFLERTLQPGGRYGWTTVGPNADDSGKAAQYLAQRRRADPDSWVLELDIPLSERFIAETIGST